MTAYAIIPVPQTDDAKQILDEHAYIGHIADSRTDHDLCRLIERLPTFFPDPAAEFEQKEEA